MELIQNPMPSATDTPAPTPNDASPGTPSGPGRAVVRLTIDGGLLDAVCPCPSPCDCGGWVVSPGVFCVLFRVWVKLHGISPGR
jgi:hypothetical protein